MGARQSQLNHEVTEDNLNLGLVNFQEEAFSFKRVNRIKMGVIFIIIILLLISIRYWLKKCKEKKHHRSL